MMRVGVAVAVVSLVIGGAGTVARGQEGAVAGRRSSHAAIAARRAALSGINLSRGQKTSLKALNQQFAQQLRRLRQANRSTGAGPNAQLRVEARRIRLEQRADIRNLLTVDQRARFDANLKAGRKQMKKRGRT
jgi:Spy/CpxP family protein refolding chaperone